MSSQLYHTAVKTLEIFRHVGEILLEIIEISLHRNNIHNSNFRFSILNKPKFWADVPKLKKTAEKLIFRQPFIE